MFKIFFNTVFSISIIFSSLNLHSQRSFRMLNNEVKQDIPFKLISNLIVFPVEVNGHELNFILDSGVGVTILFNLNEEDVESLKNIEKIKLNGLGSSEPVEAILSRNNQFKIKNILSNNQKLYVVSNDNFDLSSKMGLTIHGIIGYEIFKDFVVKINYNSKKLTFYVPDNYEYDDCKKCESLDLEFYMFKPYVNVGVVFNENSSAIPVKLLVDSGGSDALWLFENSAPNILPPTKYFDDFLGEGLNGVIIGKRSKIHSLELGKFELKEPTVSYPDSSSLGQALNYKDRNGSLGGNVLKRFIVVFDYENSKMNLKKGNSFNDPFRYNMSGIELVYNGKILVKELDKGAISYTDPNAATSHNKFTLDYNYKFTFKPTYRIHNLRIGSPAHEAGLQAGDVLIKINGTYTYELELEEIVSKFYQKENSKIELVVERNGVDYQYTFKLKDILD